jgi:4-hydroxy-3-polyprenylbenzoate decarboxylase
MALKVSQRWLEYGLIDINLQEVDANKFGYEM